jgi:hypothetical protein
MGMKWGKRKTTNNASPTAMKTHTPFQKDPNRDPPPAKGVTDLSPKHIKRISDVELRNRINRLQMETQYKQLTEGKTAPDKSKAKQAYEKFEKGHDAVKKIVAVGKTIQAIHKLATSDTVKQVAKLLNETK